MTAFIETRLAVDATAATSRTCALELALGRTFACPRHLCAFWEEGGAVVRPGCALFRAQLDLERAGAADQLLALRQRMEQSPSLEDKREAYREFRDLLVVVFDDDWE
jgi:hypothetical protein